MMNRAEMNKKLAEIASYRMMKAELQAELDRLEDEMKAYMTAEGIDEVIGDEHKVTFKTYEKKTFDSKAFKAAGYAELYEAFRMPKTEQRFTFA